MSFQVFAFLLLISSSVFAQTLSSLRYEGRLSGDPMLNTTLNNQSFEVDIRRPDCPAASLGLTPWTSNTVTVTMGTFSLSPTFNAEALALAMDPARTFAGCSGTTDARVIVIRWFDGTAWQSFSVPLNDAPRATLALNAKTAENSNRIGNVPVNPTMTCANGHLLQWDNVNSRLTCLPLATADVPALDANKIQSGTLDVARIPAAAGDVTGTLTSNTVTRIRNQPIATNTPAANQVLKFVAGQWTPSADEVGTPPGDASYTAKGLVQINTDQTTSGLFVSAGVLALPNLLTAGGPVGGTSTVPVITWDQKGRLTAVSTATVNDPTKLAISDYAADIAGANCTNVQTPYWNTVSDSWNCQDLRTSAGGFFVEGGNTFGVNATLGVNSLNSLTFETNNSPVMTLTQLGSIGIGTQAPLGDLELRRADKDAALMVRNTTSTAPRFPRMEIANFLGSAAMGHPRLELNNSRGSEGAETAINFGDTLGEISAGGNVNSGSPNLQQAAGILFVATENYSASQRGSEIRFRVTRNSGTLNDALVLENTGNLKMGFGSTLNLAPLTAAEQSSSGVLSGSPSNRGRVFFDADSARLRNHDGSASRRVANEDTLNNFSTEQTFSGGLKVGATGSSLTKITICSPSFTLGATLNAGNSIVMTQTCTGSEIGMIPHCSLENPTDAFVDMSSFNEVTTTTANTIRMKILNNSNGTNIPSGTIFSFRCILMR
ncbi:MAG: hypothetical protein ACK5Y2_07325 [Bdellovibrionales bacterium]